MILRICCWTLLHVTSWCHPWRISIGGNTWHPARFKAFERLPSPEKISHTTRIPFPLFLFRRLFETECPWSSTALGTRSSGPLQRPQVLRTKNDGTSKPGGGKRVSRQIFLLHAFVAQDCFDPVDGRFCLKITVHRNAEKSYVDPLTSWWIISQIPFRFYVTDVPPNLKTDLNCRTNFAKPVQCTARRPTLLES